MKITGKDILTGEAKSQRALLIKVKNAGQLASKQGIIATAASALLPETVEGKVYDEMKKKLASALSDEGVDAEIKVVEPAAYKASGASPIWKPMALGLAGIGVLTLLYKFFTRSSHTVHLGSGVESTKNAIRRAR